MIRAIIFDCFGVLTTDGWLPFKQRCFGHNPALMTRASELNRMSDAGLMTYHEFVDEIASMAGLPAATVHHAIESNVANEPLFSYIRELAPHYTIGLLSNASADWLQHLFSPEQCALFKAVALSYETGFVKPDPRAYEIIAERLGLEVGECLLVDDQERFCTGAREAGMPAIWYKSVEQLKAELASTANIT
jgi:HAD superfamily hydrolase (TIGR01509 family)